MTETFSSHTVKKTITILTSIAVVPYALYICDTIMPGHMHTHIEVLTGELRPAVTGFFVFS